MSSVTIINPFERPQDEEKRALNGQDRLAAPPISQEATGQSISDFVSSASCKSSLSHNQKAQIKIGKSFSCGTAQPKITSDHRHRKQ